MPTTVLRSSYRIATCSSAPTWALGISTRTKESSRNLSPGRMIVLGLMPMNEIFSTALDFSFRYQRFSPAPARPRTAATTRAAFEPFLELVPRGRFLVWPGGGSRKLIVRDENDRATRRLRRLARRSSSQRSAAAIGRLRRPSRSGLAADRGSRRPPFPAELALSGWRRSALRRAPPYSPRGRGG